MLQTEYLELSVDTINYVDSKDEVELIDVIKIDNNLWGRLDILIKRYYNNDMSILPIILDFNEISDVTEIKIGTLIKLPYINSLETVTKLSVNNIYETEKVPGIIEKTKTNNFLIKNNSKQKAMPRLNLELEKITYNKNTGEVIY